MEQSIVFILFIIIVIGLLIFAVLMNAKRKKEWQKFAVRNNLSYLYQDTIGVPSRYSAFHLFQRGHSRKAYNLCQGKIDNKSYLFFDYRYTTGSGKNKQTHYYTGLIVNSTFAFQPLVIRPEHFLDKIAAAIGFDDIDFESSEFSTKFHISSSNKKFAYDIIHPRMMEFLLNTTNLNIECMGTDVLFHYGKQVPINKADILILESKSFFKLIPEYLRQEQNE